MAFFNSLILNKKNIIVAIDFGTTFSGVAWAKIGDNFPYLVQEWPGINAPTSEKVPTELLYDDDTPFNIRWGYQIPKAAQPHKWFKIALEDTKTVPTTTISANYPDDNETSVHSLHMAHELTTDYLIALKTHLISILGRQIGPTQAKNTPLEFILTVPAMWSEFAKENTLVAAEKAGLGQDAPICMISEPEAAAVCVLHRQKLHNLLIGDTFVVCDAGGGTVDLISYTVVRLDPIIEVKEAAPGNGALCGSTYINRRFKEFLENKLGRQKGWDDEILQDAMADFEAVVKRGFSVAESDNNTYRVSVSGLAPSSALGNKRGGLFLKSGDIEEILEPVVSEVVSLILSQIRSTKNKVKSVLLVGGFGKSPYLRERIQKVVKNTVEVIQPPYGWSAVVQGALIQRLAHYDSNHATVRLLSRAARKHGGTKGSFFNPQRLKSNLLLIGTRYFDGFSGSYKAVTMSWFIKKGDDVKEDSPFLFHFYQKFLVSDGFPSLFDIPIFCDRSGRLPVIHLDGKVEQFVELAADLTEIPLKCLQIEEGWDGRFYYDVRFSIKVMYLSASTEYEFIHDGKRYGKVTAQYA